MTGRDPFPGLRPFEPHESDLYFGRDEQCDDLLSRLARRRLLAARIPGRERWRTVERV